MKPEIVHDAKLAAVSRDARLAFIYLWTVADDKGYFRADLKYLAGALFPKDKDVTERVLRGWLHALKGIGVIELVQTDDGLMGHVTNWNKHQKIDHPSRSYIEHVAKGSRDPREHVAKGSRDPREDVAKGSRDPLEGSLEPRSLEPRSLEPESKSKALVALARDNGMQFASEMDKADKGKAVTEALKLGARVVFNYWRARMGKTDRTILDRERTSKLTARLRENHGDVSELLYAVDGALHDEYLMGRDPDAKRRYDGIETIFRNRGQVERLVSLAPGRQPVHPALHDGERGRDGDAKPGDAGGPGEGAGG